MRKPVFAARARLPNPLTDENTATSRVRDGIRTKSDLAGAGSLRNERERAPRYPIGAIGGMGGHPWKQGGGERSPTRPVAQKNFIRWGTWPKIQVANCKNLSVGR